MPRTIPIALANDYARADEGSTFAALVKVICRDGTRLAFTSLDAALVYDDGDDILTYSPDNGVTGSRLQSATDFSVDNAEYSGIVRDSGISEADIRAGLFDFARIIAYEVNYEALSHGHRIICKGTAGETTFDESQFKIEFRSLTQQTKQPISTPYSLTCRARFGSKPIGTVGAEITERYPCNKDFVWVTGTVTSLGTETDRMFSDASLPQSSGHFFPGVVEILSGNNQGVQMDVEEYAGVSDGGEITLLFPLPYPLTIGTSYRIRQDCDKTKSMCKERHNNLPNMRAEHLTPVGDAGSIMVPGAYIEAAGT